MKFQFWLDLRLSFHHNPWEWQIYVITFVILLFNCHVKANTSAFIIFRRSLISVNTLIIEDQFVDILLKKPHHDRYEILSNLTLKLYQNIACKTKFVMNKLNTFLSHNCKVSTCISNHKNKKDMHQHSVIELCLAKVVKLLTLAVILILTHPKCAALYVRIFVEALQAIPWLNSNSIKIC